MVYTRVPHVFSRNLRVVLRHFAMRIHGLSMVRVDLHFSLVLLYGAYSAIGLHGVHSFACLCFACARVDYWYDLLFACWHALFVKACLMSRIYA